MSSLSAIPQKAQYQQLPTGSGATQVPPGTAARSRPPRPGLHPTHAGNRRSPTAGPPIVRSRPLAPVGKPRTIALR